MSRKPGQSRSVRFADSAKSDVSHNERGSRELKQQIIHDESEDSEPISDSVSEHDDTEDQDIEEFEGYDSNEDDADEGDEDQDMDGDDFDDANEDDEADEDGDESDDPYSRVNIQNDDVLDRLETQMAALEKEDTLALMRTTQTASKEKKKAMHVSQQLASWRNALQLRLRLQRPLAIAERLPTSQLLPEFIRRRPEVGTSLHTAALNVADVLGDLIEIERGISLAAPALSSTGVNEIAYSRPTLLGGEDANKEPQRQGLKRLHPSSRATDEDLEYIENYLSSSWEASESQRNSILDKWSRRVNVAAGKADMQTGTGSSGLKVIGQSLSAQIAQTLDVESDRLTQRTKMRRLTTRSLGAPEPPKIAAWEDRTVRAAHEAAHKFDDDIFDDFDFYSVLVRELSSVDQNADETALAKSGMYNAKTAAAALAELRLRRQLEKGIDRRASKGRKLRFAPIPKLANFMVPITNAAWLAACASGPDSAEEAVTDELLLSLFGDSNVMSRKATQERTVRTTQRALEVMAEREGATEQSSYQDADAQGDFEDVEGVDDDQDSSTIGMDQGPDHDDEDEGESHFAWFK